MLNPLSGKFLSPAGDMRVAIDCFQESVRIPYRYGETLPIFLVRSISIKCFEVGGCTPRSADCLVARTRAVQKRSETEYKYKDFLQSP